jgi:hypothetical protein
MVHTIKTLGLASKISKIDLAAALIFILVTPIMLICWYTPCSVSAHISKTYGNFTLEVGWMNEPPLVGEINNAIIQVNETAGSSSTAVRNALSNINIMVKYGGVTKPLDFVPSEQAEGLYEAEIIPTRIGSYSLLLNGTIKSQNILNAEIPLDFVEGKAKLSFPDTGNPSDSVNINSPSNNIGTSLEGILNQLSNDIDNNTGNIDILAKNNMNVQKSIQDISSASDRSYMIGITAIGVGVAGIVVAGVALSRKSS